MAEIKKLRHVAIIMDGNGRWAKKRGLQTVEGHKAGAESVKRAIEYAGKTGLEYLTLFAFSTENWKRPEEEVNALMELLYTFIEENIEEVNKEGIRIKVIGRLEQIPERTRKRLLDAIGKTSQNKKGTVVLALNYGGRAEIIDAVKKYSDDLLAGKTDKEALTEESFRNYLYDPEIPDPELMIRTSGEFRISNFLLWEISYSEIYISDVFWPDFDENEFEKAIQSYYGRERRFGERA